MRALTEPMRPIDAASDETVSGGSDLSFILNRAALGDEDAWRRLVDLYARRVFALARSRRLSPDRAEEVAQSVFVTVATHVRSGDYTEKGRFEAWLFRIAVNRVRDEIRRDRRRPLEIGGESLQADPGMVAQERPIPGESEQAAALRAALDELSEADREVVELRHHAGLGFREIASLLSQPLGTVLARHHRALHKLKEIIGRATIDPRARDGDPEHV
jgi:RNA polymerase sigma-70 factor (ECF subfamily)